MQDKNRRKSNPTSASVDRLASESMKDPASARLKGASASVGNETIQQRLASGQSSRDEMLQFLVERLATLRGVQQEELRLLDENLVASNRAAMAPNGKESVTEPDPMRWHAAARLYEQAAIHLCRGSLARGTELLNQAVAEERRTFDSLTSLVNLEDIDNMFDEAIPEDPPVGLADLEVTATAACDLPEGVAVAKEIQNVVAETPELTWNMRERDPWWTLDEEEEEEEAQGGVGGG